jgi:hypothetical protein
MRIESQLRSSYCASSLPYDSIDYAGPVSPLLTLVVLPEAGFSALLMRFVSRYVTPPL